MGKNGNVASAIEIMEARSAVYRMFASLYFKELTLDQMKALSEQDLDGLSDLDPDIERGIRAIKHALRRLHEGTREDLAVDYAHTFLSAGTTKNEKRACPFESVFTSQEGLLMQEARDDVFRLMLSEQVEPLEDLHVPEDHISFEFEFMALLGDRMVQAVREGALSEAQRLLAVQDDFLERHIVNWIDDFCDAIDHCCRTDFYRGVSAMTRSFAHLDIDLLREATTLLRQAA